MAPLLNYKLSLHASVSTYLPSFLVHNGLRNTGGMYIQICETVGYNRVMAECFPGTDKPPRSTLNTYTVTRSTSLQQGRERMQSVGSP